MAKFESSIEFGSGKSRNKIGNTWPRFLQELTSKGGTAIPVPLEGPYGPLEQPELDVNPQASYEALHADVIHDKSSVLSRALIPCLPWLNTRSVLDQVFLTGLDPR